MPMVVPGHARRLSDSVTAWVALQLRVTLDVWLARRTDGHDGGSTAG
jgi:hypothetical protein